MPLLPLAGSLAAAALGWKILKEKSHWPVILGVGASAVLSLVVLAITAGDGGESAPARISGYDWISVGGLVSLISAAVDPLTAIMLVTVSVVSLLVVIYSKGYMAGDAGYFRFFSYMGLFIFSMLMLVLADNFLMLYVFWEAVGLCSYLLIGFYYRRPAAAAAAKKAFVVNRIGDFGFAIGILLIFLNFGTVSFQEVFAAVPAFAENHPETVTWIALCLFTGAVGKSAQLPLYVWLPDAMEGPSPVSALIHAATMVTAGVYMVVRCGAIFVASPVAMTVVAVVGGMTALFAATIAICQTDIKRILAYSTVSQLGYMFLAVGVGAASAGVFHLYTHAFFKALLFLAAGSIMHAMHHRIDLKDIGGLKNDIPVTRWTFLIGAMALSGVPFLSGFFS
ncbi:MAG: NADH-quinone oxidoreductase subunit L, partial [Planctomycetes bacterium]|nr:NADH-quinone oxidoreductase subunit L [Planctomycetota bacterium]